MIGIEKQGQVIRMVDLSPKFSPAATPQKRGQVTEFSRKSRRRMIDLMNRLDLEGRRATFLTLTFKYTHDHSETKAAFKRFLAYLAYHYPNTSGIWRLEFQKRGTPHYHLILFDLPYWKHKAIRKVWMRCTREPASGVRVNLLRGAKQAMYYVSKYVAKLPDLDSTPLFIDAPYQQNEGEQWTGRFWGLINVDALPYAERLVGVINDPEMAHYFWHTVGTLLTKPNGKRRSSQRLYTQEAQVMYEWVMGWGADDVTGCWHERLAHEEVSSNHRTKASLFFAGINTHH